MGWSQLIGSITQSLTVLVVCQFTSRIPTTQCVSTGVVHGIRRALFLRVAKEGQTGDLAESIKCSFYRPCLQKTESHP